MRARDVMSHPAVTVQDSTSVQDAARLLTRLGFTAAPVVDDDGRLIGIITEADLLREQVPADPRVRGISVSRPRPPRTVGEVMTSPVESLTPGADIADAARMMVEERIRCLPIVNGRSVLGVLTRRDILRAAVARNDADLEREITASLETVDKSGRWRVSVQAGVAEIEDYTDDISDREIARQLAEAIPGVVSVTARHQTPDPS